MKKISRQEFDGLIEEYREHILPNVHPEYTRVARVSNRILNGNKDLRQIYDKTWTVTVVDQPVQNAFVLPSGNIFISKGCWTSVRMMTNLPSSLAMRCPILFWVT